MPIADIRMPKEPHMTMATAYCFLLKDTDSLLTIFSYRLNRIMTLIFYTFYGRCQVSAASCFSAAIVLW